MENVNSFSTTEDFYIFPCRFQALCELALVSLLRSLLFLQTNKYLDFCLAVLNKSAKFAPKYRHIVMMSLSGGNRYDFRG